MRILLAFLLSSFAVSALAANPGTLLVLNKADNTVSLLDLATKKSVATIPTGNGPHEVAVSPDGKIAVVCNYGSQDAPGSTLTVIDSPRASRCGRSICSSIAGRMAPHGCVVTRWR
jgi:YVTN family beta-propeller protein